MKGDKNMADKAINMSAKQLARYIDHSVLKPQFTISEIAEQIRKGIEYGCKTVAINPTSIALAKSLCEGTETGLCVTCDFPFGTSTTESKLRQAESILRHEGVAEIDFVANYGLARSGEWNQFAEDIKAVVDLINSQGVITKVILETDALTEAEIFKASEVASKTGVDFVKTSTGFYTEGQTRGAAIEVVKIMMDGVAGRCRVKGSGNIRTRNHFLSLIDLGVDRLGIGYRSTAEVIGS